MNQSTIAVLHCPHCGSTFHINQILEENKGDITHALIGCECPLADRILPQELEIDKEILRIAKEAETEATLEEIEEIRKLMEKFVLINVPPNYI